MSSTASDMVTLGEVTSPFGAHGCLKIQSFTDPPEALFNYPRLYYQLQGYWLSLTITEYDTHKNHFIITTPQVESLEQAQNLTHCPISTPRSELTDTPQNQYYWHDLLGFKVYNQQGDYLGPVCQFLPTGSKDVMVIEGQKRYLIPFVVDIFVLKVDIDNQQMIVDWDS